jgi:hypothetical protein
MNKDALRQQDTTCLMAKTGPDKSEPQPASTEAGAIDLAALFRQDVPIHAGRGQLLRQGLTDGLAFFQQYNEARLKLAFSYFDPTMTLALFEILFLLNSNDPSLKEVKFQAAKPGAVPGKRTDTVAETANLYQEGAPCGVSGIDRLSPVFRDAYEAHIRATFGLPATVKAPQGGVFVTIQSTGSIGTVGHKSRSSDLDLEVIYSLLPTHLDTRGWSNETFHAAIMKEQFWWLTRHLAAERLAMTDLDDSATRLRIESKAMASLAKAYPALYPYLVERTPVLAERLRSSEGPGVRAQALQELIQLMKRAAALGADERVQRQEALLQERVARIETYIQRKYPQSEVHLFTYPIVSFRLARHSSTLESKESSGAAYELILNYDTLMPGIHINPTVPAHFVMPKIVNDDPAVYGRLVDYIHFDVIELYRPVREQLIDLGPTPDLSVGYVADHLGAIYWEAFKASSGNLPKATLNLLRYEMLLDPRHLKTIIQLIKHPQALDGLVSRPPEDPAAVKAEKAIQEQTGIAPWALLELEAAFPYLLQDPWWLRYKVLKIAFHEPNGVADVHPEERREISRLMDLAFALHVRISDVMTKPGDTRKLESPREKALQGYLQLAFPPGSPRRTTLEQIFIGEVQGVNRFESQLRDMFKRSMNRVGNKTSRFKIKEAANKAEQELWLQYYLQNFEPMPEVVQRTILNHLMVPRGRVQVGYHTGAGWFFKSLQRESSIGKRFDTFGVLDTLPDEVMLIEKVGFLSGLAHCIVNGYYGVLNRGTLKERRTALELDGKHLDLGHPVHNTLGFIRPDMVDRILGRVQEFFTHPTYDYTDMVRKERKTIEVFAFLNLWKFGSLALLSQNDVGTWYCREFDLPEILQRYKEFTASPDRLLNARPLHQALAAFFKQEKVNINAIRLACWVNPNSVTTNHSPGQEVAKERELAKAFETAVRRAHRTPDPTPPGGVPPGTAPAGGPAPPAAPPGPIA